MGVLAARHVELQAPMGETILSSLKVNLAILDSDGFIVHVSDSWTRFGRENGSSATACGVGINYIEVCRRSQADCPDARVVLDGILAVMNGAIPLFQHEYRCDSISEPRWFVLTVTPSPVGAGVLLLHRDDTAIRKGELRFGELLDSVRAIVWRAEAPTFHTTYVSKQAVEILGFPAERWTKEPDLWQKRIHPDDREWVINFSSDAIREKRKHSFEYRMIAADGRIVWLRNIVNVVVENGHPRQLVSVSTDVTERKLAEETRDQFTVRLLRAQEEERSSIARELHDDIAQSLAVLTMKLEKVRKVLANHDSAGIQGSCALARKIADDVQRLSHGLHPALVETLGLARAVEHLCSQFAENSAAKLKCRVGQIPRDLDKNVAACLSRVLQECLRNAAKHSKAKQITIKLDVEFGQIRLRVADDGVGFNPAADIYRQGLGLASMKERLRLIGGMIEVMSSRGRGTSVLASAPLSQKAKSQLPICA